MNKCITNKQTNKIMGVENQNIWVQGMKLDLSRITKMFPRYALFLVQFQELKVTYTAIISHILIHNHNPTFSTHLLTQSKWVKRVSGPKWVTELPWLREDLNLGLPGPSPHLIDYTKESAKTKITKPILLITCYPCILYEFSQHGFHIWGGGTQIFSMLQKSREQ